MAYARAILGECHGNFIFLIFHLLFLGCGRPWITKVGITESTYTLYYWQIHISFPEVKILMILDTITYETS